MNYNLSGKKALITGSTAGIGLAIATGLVVEGVECYINGRTQVRVDKAYELIKGAYPAADVHGVVADFANKADVDKIIESVPQVDILINNVGIFEPKEFADISDEDWYHLFEVNVMSGIRLSRHYMPLMLAEDWGRIIFISSESAVQIPEEMIHYGMTKTAQLSVASGLARLTKGTGVTVNSVLPGPTMSEGADRFLEAIANEQKISKQKVEEDFFKNGRPGSLLQRFASTEEVANLVVYLSSYLSSATNGAALRVDGGAVPTIL